MLLSSRTVVPFMWFCLQFDFLVTLRQIFQKLCIILCNTCLYSQSCSIHVIKKSAMWSLLGETVVNSEAVWNSRQHCDHYSTTKAVSNWMAWQVTGSFKVVTSVSPGLHIVTTAVCNCNGLNNEKVTDEYWRWTGMYRRQQVVWFVGPTVFRGPWNFEPSHGICPLPQNFDISAEFCRIWKMTGNSFHGVLCTSTAFLLNTGSLYFLAETVAEPFGWA